MCHQLAQGQGRVGEAGDGGVEQVLVVARAHDLQLTYVEIEQIDGRLAGHGREDDQSPLGTQESQALAYSLAGADCLDHGIVAALTGCILGFSAQPGHGIVNLLLVDLHGAGGKTQPEIVPSRDHHFVQGQRLGQPRDEHAEGTVANDQQGVSRRQIGLVQCLQADGDRFRQRGHRERHRVGDVPGAVGTHREILGKDAGAIEGEVAHVQAEMAHAAAAIHTLAAGMDGMGGHAIAHLEIVDLRADSSHRTRSFMAHDDGQLDAEGVLAQIVEVGRADHGGAGLDQQLVVADGRQVSVNQRHLLDGLKLQCFHWSIPRRCRASRCRMPSMVSSVTRGRPLLPMMWLALRSPSMDACPPANG